MDDRHDRLLDSIASLDSDGLALPAETLGSILAEGKRQGMPWELAWNTAINVSAPARHGGGDSTIGEQVTEQRELLAEVKPHFRAAYEGQGGELHGFSAAARRAEKRLADLDVPTLDEFPGVRGIAPAPVAGAKLREAA